MRLPTIYILFSLTVRLSAVEVELSENEVVDVEVVFPKQNGGDGMSGADTMLKTNAFVSFIDRLLNRNQQVGGSASSSTNSGSSSGTVSATTRRTSVLGSLIFVPDVTKGVDTILGGVATGNLEQIISGSFIFAPPQVQTVANTVINRVFGGQSIANIPNNGNSNSNNNNNKNNNNNINNSNNVNQAGSGSGGNLVEAVKQIQQSSQSVTAAPDIDIRVQRTTVNTTTTDGGFFSNIFGSLYSKKGVQIDKPSTKGAAPSP